MPSSSYVTEDSLKRILDNKFKPLELKIKGIVQSIDFMSAKQSAIEETNLLLEKENDLLKNQVYTLQNQVQQLSGSVNDLKQYGRRECLEIRGVPVQRDEDIEELICSIADLVQVPITSQYISACLKDTKNSSTFPPT